MPLTIEIENASYGPNPFYVRQGGNRWAVFDVVFSGGTPPASFDYAYRMKDPGGTAVLTVSGTENTNGQERTTVSLSFPAVKDSGGPLDFGNYLNEFEASSNPSTTITVCTGTPVVPEPDDDCE